ncbi:MAG TPA: YqaJ viral recombinase family protein [Usitatibacter sp.]|nr:YqaJ viral recombinase family protein [Usitatibacter sp.]
MKVLDFPQGSAEWAQARAGRVTASRIDAVLSRARDRKSEGATRRNYKAQIIAEVLTGKPQENGFTNRAIEDGIEQEPFARAAYEIRRGYFVDQVGFVVHPTIERAGASPDGLVGTDGLIQIKCPIPATHIGYLLDDDVPAEYQPQMLWEMACTGRAWCDFVSYSTAFPPSLQLFVKRFPRDDKRIAEITAEVNVFLKEADDIIARLTRSQT